MSVSVSVLYYTNCWGASVTKTHIKFKQVFDMSNLYKLSFLPCGCKMCAQYTYGAFNILCCHSSSVTTFFWSGLRWICSLRDWTLKIRRERWAWGGNTPQIFHNMMYITQYIKQTAQQQLWRLWKQWCTSVGVKERITEFGSWEIPCIPKCRDHCILCVREMQISVSVSSQKMLTWKS